MRVALLLALLSGCHLPKPGTCQCVCAWQKPTDESGRFFEFLYSVDGGIQ